MDGLNLLLCSACKVLGILKQTTISLLVQVYQSQ